jgi:murein DD-endopeptidase MepM/ murein hydrolase activator NlpD
MRFRSACLLLLLGATPAAALDLDGAPRQGGIVRGVAPPGDAVLLDGRAVPVAPDGHFILGFARDAAAKATLTIGGERHALEVARGHFVVQRIDGLPPQTVTPDPATLKRILAEADRMKAARHAGSRLLDAFSRFIWPVTGPFSGSWGSQRILNGEPRSPHLGVDIAVPAGTPVLAPAGGVVRLAATGFVLTGGTIILDHGYGLTTLYAHLSQVEVTEGETVRQGQEIAKVGATGRVTGPHLHWGAAVGDVQVDPSTLVPPMPAPE